jgi:Asp-tRNA(Asn)/Glu-tRNA(Gln) amidotransferase A subunit family amidase
MTKIQSIESSTPIHYLEASTLAALISSKHLSSREVVRAYLDRTEAVNPKINAVVTLMGEAALKAAPRTRLWQVALRQARSTACPSRSRMPWIQRVS